MRERAMKLLVMTVYTGKAETPEEFARLISGHIPDDPVFAPLALALDILVAKGGKSVTMRTGPPDESFTVERSFEIVKGES